ncbi:GNAT family N-acetyltransferase [Amycolatopsis sp. NPDC049159]|uniref:GNAT family N-acetyltransferase n=1 Tax=unclassified Amycolatopsis TaxID=2618356 RepID=UPI0033D6160B
MPELIPPDVRWHAAWRDAHAEWGPGAHEDGFGLQAADRVGTAAGFAAWLARLNTEACTYRWIVEGERVLGGIALRHGFGEFVRQFGHVGYGIRPSARGRGLASWALGRILGEARTLGMSRVLLVCAADNVASARTIERNGGVLEASPDHRVRRYWIENSLSSDM